jgi:acyl carrier protein
VAPRTPVEEVLAGIWCEVLKLDRVGVHDNFFELGGHSLLATRVMARLREAFGIDLPLRTLFDTANVSELATRIEVLQRAAAIAAGDLADIIDNVGDMTEAEAENMLKSLAEV